MSARPVTAFKVVDQAEWTTARARGHYHGSAVDRADGYIHLSTAGQLVETIRKHYAGRRDLRLLTVDLSALGDGVVWEPSRGGDLFPHQYGPLPVSAVVAERGLSVADDGAMILDDGAGG